MAVKYEVLAATGTYQKDGQEKTRWTKIGIVIEKDASKMSLKLESIPTAWDGWAILSPPKTKEDLPF